MLNKCHAKCDGTDFYGTLIAAWLGASIAIGSCGSCDPFDDVGDKVDRLERTVTHNLNSLEHDIQRVTRNMRTLELNIQDLRVYMQTPITPSAEQEIVSGQTYTIEGQEYQLVPRIGDQGYQFVPVEQNQPTP